MAVTHDRYFLDNVTGWILELDRGHGLPYEGNYSSWLEQKQKRLAHEERSEKARQRTIAAELEWVRQNPKGRQTKQKARLRNYEALVAEERNVKLDQVQIHIPAGPRLGEIVVEAEGLRKGFGDRLLIEDLSFSLPRGGIVGVIGANGAGKTTLFRMITGEEQPDGGTLKIGETVELAYVDQSRDALDPDKTVWQEISGEQDTIQVGDRTMNSRAYCSGFNFKGSDQQKEVGKLSGGERNRAAPGQAAAHRRQRPAPRRADERPRRRHAARPRGGAARRSRAARWSSPTIAGSWTASRPTSSRSRATRRSRGSRATSRPTRSTAASGSAPRPTARTGSRTRSSSAHERPRRDRALHRPTCPWAFSAEPQRWRLRWLYGDQLAWTDRMVVLSEDAAEVEAVFPPEVHAEALAMIQQRFGMPIDTARAPAQRRVGARVRRGRRGAPATPRPSRRSRCCAPCACGSWAASCPTSRRRSRAPRRTRDWTPEQLQAWTAVRATRPPRWRPIAPPRAIRCPPPACSTTSSAARPRSAATPARATSPSRRRAARPTAPGYQPIESYEVMLANVAPGLHRRDEPSGVAEVLAWAGTPLATAEVALLCGMDHDEAREALVEAGAVERPVGADAYWSL